VRVFCSPPVGGGGDPAAVVRSGTALGTADVDLDAKKRVWRVLVGRRRTRETNMRREL
jgi:hypothetical protein